MSILPRLIALFRATGHEPVTGYNSFHFDGYMDAPFTKFVKDKTVMGCAGLALQEIMFLEHFSTYLSPKNILVIGNAHGWSTIALSLIFPSATVVAIDPGKIGNDVTNGIARSAELNVKALEGYSPQDVDGISTANFEGPVDLVLVDAIHTNAAVLADFDACKPVGHPGTVYVFHDVLNHRLIDAINKIKADNALEGQILTRTASGMAVLWQTAPADFRDYVGAFSEPPSFFRSVRRLMLENYAPNPSHLFDKL